MMQKWADYLDALRENKNTDNYKHGFKDDNVSDQIKILIDQLGENTVLEMLSYNA